VAVKENGSKMPPTFTKNGGLDSKGMAFPSNQQGRTNAVQRTPMLTILLIILVLALLGALPAWPYSHAWGYYPSGGLGLLLIIVILLMLL
jgi:hypothetical protein